MDADELLADLDDGQRRAVAADSTLVAVVAGAGSGKTRVLTRRIAHRLATGSADAQHTLALTFTREAAGELRRRLRRLGHRDAIEIGTFHSVLLGVLRRRWADDDRSPKTVAGDRRRLLDEAIRGVSGAANRSSVLLADAEIGWAGAHGLDSTTYVEHARRARRRPTGGVGRVAEWFAAYEQLKRRRGVIDFDDVLTMTLAEARRDHSFAEVLRWRFRHLHVDEAQDLNPVQHQVIDLLRQGRDDVFLVGDPSQAIYGFNGADPTLLVEVEERFPGIEVIRLPVNHRSTPQIVAAGMHVLARGEQPVELRSARPDGPVVEQLTADDEEDEASQIARLVVRSDAGLVRSSNVAVLARTHAQLEPIAVALDQAGVPVRRASTRTGSPIQAALRQAAGQTSPSGLRGWAHDVLDDVAALESARAQVAARADDISGRAGGARRGAAAADAPAVLEVVEAERRVAAAVLDFLRDRPRGDGAEFRTWVATTAPFDRPSDDGGVELLTFHAAKGREWHTVLVAGVETGLAPHKSATTATTRAEETRLVYVAVTRATDRLILCRARRRGGYERRPSPLLEGLDAVEPTFAPPPRALLRRRRVPTDQRAVALHAWRDEAARRANVLPTQLCSDRDLAAIASERPRTAEQLAEVTSMGPITAERLAPEVLPLLDAE